MNFSSPFIRRPIGTTLLAIGLFLLGAVAYVFLPVASLPTFDLPTISVAARTTSCISPRLTMGHLPRSVTSFIHPPGARR